MPAQDDDFLGPEFDQEKSGTADNLTPKQTHVFDWDKSIILDDIDEKPEATINANSSSKDQYCVLSGELTPSTYNIICVYIFTYLKLLCTLKMASRVFFVCKKCQ